MALSIRNEKTEELARKVAAETGETLTEAITKALEARLRVLSMRRSADDTIREMMQISARCSALPDLDPRTPDEILGYDEKGVTGSW